MKDKDKYNIIPMIDNACKIVSIISENGGEAGISYIAKKTDLSKSTIFRILYTLQEHRMIQKNDSNDKYALGMFFMKAGEQIKNSLDIKKVALPIMEKIADNAGETINLGILYENKVLILNTVSGEDSILVSKLEPICPLYCSGIGKLLMQNFSVKEIKQYYQESPIKKRTINTIIEYQGMIERQKKISECGYSIDDEEYEFGLYCIAAPIYSSKGDIIAGVSISGPTSRINYKGESELTEMIINAAHEISRRMGYEG